MAYCSLAQAPKSMARQRAEQNGRKRFVAVNSTARSQVGQATTGGALSPEPRVEPPGFIENRSGFSEIAKRQSERFYGLEFLDFTTGTH
jgi:hypothetical protein